MFNSLFDVPGLTSITVLINLVASILCGVLIATMYHFSDRPSKNYCISVSILPAIVMLVILMVNGNIGVGVAVAGSFSLVRFRSLPGKASDIIMIFMSMGIGLMTGMGYATLAVISTIFLLAVYWILTRLPLFAGHGNYRNIRITMPEDLDYTNVFEEVFATYTKDAHLVAVKTVNLGTMFQATYECVLKDPKLEKELMDALRTRNGNLSIQCSELALPSTEL